MPVAVNLREKQQKQRGQLRITAVLLAFLPVMIGAGSTLRSDALVIETFDAVVESHDGERLRVVFENAGQPALWFKPAHGAWDWSATSKLIFPVENPGENPVTVLLRVDSVAGHSLLGRLAIAPHAAKDLAMQLNAPSPRAMGMIAGPPPLVTAQEHNIAPVTATEGSVDAAQVSSVRLGIPRPSAPQRLIIGPLRVEPPDAADKSAYLGIVDGFGQYRPATWPEKVSSVETLRARGAEEARERAEWLARLPARDRFGGLEGGGFRATGFFHTEKRDGRWWLVTPDGNPFFSIGMDVVAPGGPTYVDGREFMFRDLPARDGELAAHWSEHDDRRGFGVQRGRGYDHGHAFDFFTANLERKFSAEWRARWREEAVERLTAWGFNTIGDWSDPELCAMRRLPYTVPLSPEGEFAKVTSDENLWGPMPDVFDPRFTTAIDAMARHAAARFRGDPYLIG
ncbi:MAG TPA: hypothetical protein VE687_08905, partial [Stellaceae bacterium]|nr:hypothetical protein [Stellaceae bacterium]